MEASQKKLRSRLEEEEQAKAALSCRIKRLTKLLLVLTKSSTRAQEIEEDSWHQRRRSLGDENVKNFVLLKNNKAYRNMSRLCS